MSVKSVAAFAMLIHLLGPRPEIFAQGAADLAGRPVIVISDAAELHSDEQPLATVPRGETLRPEKSQVDSLWVKWEGDSGRLDRRHVLPVQQAIDQLSRSIQTDPKNSGLYVARGAAWREKKEFDIALADFNEAIRLDPASGSAYRGRALTWEMKKEFDKAISDHTESLRLDAKSASAYYSRGWNRFQMKEDEQAMADFNEALKIKPRFVRPLMFRGYVWERRDDHDRAIADFSEALRLEPGAGNVRFSRGWNLFEKTEYEQALADFEEAARQDPGNLRAADYRRRCWSELGQFGKVIADYEALLRANPKDVSARERLARLRATCPIPEFRNGRQAVELARKACEMTQYKSAPVLDTLAAAYAEAGQFDQAANWQNQALALAEATAKKDFQARLDLYAHAQPLREDPGTRYAWQVFASKDGRYRAQFPGNPDDRVDRPESAFHQHQSGVKTANKLVFFVGYGDLPPDARKTDPEGDKTLKALLDSMAGSMKLVSERKLMLGDHSGREKLLESAKGESFIFRGFIVGTRLYHLFVAGSSREMSRNRAAVARFLDSFALLPDVPPDGLSALDGWQEILSESGRFRVEFPIGKVEPINQPDADSGLHEFGLQLQGGVKLAAGYGDLTADLKKQYPEAKQRLEALRDIMAARTGSKVVSDRDLTLLGFSGVEFVLEDKDGTIIIAARLYIVHDRIYQCTVFAPAARFQTDSEVIRRFLESFALLSVASQDGQLALEGIQACYGPQGPVRQNRLYFPFDTIQFRAKMRGLILDAQRRPDCEIISNLVDAAGTTVFTDRIRIQSAPSATGGAAVPFDIAVPVPQEPKPGEYSFVLILKDLRGGREASFLRRILIQPAELAIVSLEFFRDAEEKVPGPAGGDANRPFHARLRAIGYDRSSGRLDTAMTMQLYDEQGRQLLNPPLELVLASDDPEQVQKASFVTFSAKLTIDRPGQFLLRITVQDRIGGKSARLEVPVVVTARPVE